MDSLPAEPARVHNRRVTPEDFASCYALLAETFAPDELESAAVMQADLATLAGDRQPVQYIMLARRLPEVGPVITTVRPAIGQRAGSGDGGFAA